MSTFHLVPANKRSITVRGPSKGKGKDVRKEFSIFPLSPPPLRDGNLLTMATKYSVFKPFLEKKKKDGNVPRPPPTVMENLIFLILPLGAADKWMMVITTITHLSPNQQSTPSALGLVDLMLG